MRRPSTTGSGRRSPCRTPGTPKTARTAAATYHQIPNPHLWQGKSDPYLYRAIVEVIDADSGSVTEAVTNPLGLRSYRIDANLGLFLNGRHVPLHGVNAHQDRLDKGWAVSASDRVQDFDLMDEMGVNALRTAHYQQAPQVYELADQRGYLVWTEVPLVDEITDGDAFRANIQQQLVEMVRQNYNHPSILFWGIGNEQRTNDAATNEVLDGLAGLVRSEDPDRLSTYATNQGDTDELANHTDVIGYNKYYGWYDTSELGPGAWADQLHAKDPGRRMSISEYGAGASVLHHEEDPEPPVTDGEWHPEEYQSLVHEQSWKEIASRPFLWGTFVWNMFDFASDGRAEGDTPGRNDKGLVTFDRATKKDSFFWYKANWTTTPFVHLTSKRWTNRSDATTTVKVYGTVDSVTLTVNGVSMGARTSSDHIYTWPDVRLSTGANDVVVTGTRDGATHTDTATWYVGE
ncbi:glycoside hydrolase family 2 protein [Saccharopolyspora sp. 5N708]|uniref:glycoside hydrolase family 2 protein n=1 Tax=Saccharopolyspora sp. 5N708 TaxID=3457424 RepID=UPI003FD29EC6